MRIARVPFASRLPHATWAAVGQSNARRQNLPRRASYARLFQDSGVLARLPVQFEAGADALAAVGLAEIRDRGGNLEWPVKLLLGAQGVVRDGVVAGAGLAGAEGRARRQDVELDASFIAEDLWRQGSGGSWQGHQRDVVRPSHGLTTRLSD
jgi:hypothetical protein